MPESQSHPRRRFTAAKARVLWALGLLGFIGFVGGLLISHESVFMAYFVIALGYLSLGSAIGYNWQYLRQKAVEGAAQPETGLLVFVTLFAVLSLIYLATAWMR